jgi:hypothetical protein
LSHDGNERAEALRVVFAELAALSAHKAAAELNARKVATPTGSPWSPQTVIRVRARLPSKSNFNWRSSQNRCSSPGIEEDRIMRTFISLIAPIMLSFASDAAIAQQLGTTSGGMSAPDLASFVKSPSQDFFMDYRVFGA